MIKACNIVLKNSAVTVVDFDGVKVQFPAIKSNSEFVYVEHKDDRYSIVSEEEYKNSLNIKVDKKPKKSKASEAGLAKEVVKSEAVKDETEEISE